MMQSEDYVLISALQHYAYCPRQCALIHVEQTFEENLYTLRGQRVHERVNIPEYELIEGVRIERALPLYSHRIGLTGIADVVEFTTNGIPQGKRIMSIRSKNSRFIENSCNKLELIEKKLS